MHPRLAQENDSRSMRNRKSSIRRPAFWCGVLLILGGLSAAGLVPSREIGDTKTLVILLLSAGTGEALAGILDHRAGSRTASMDILLGLLSMMTGALLATPNWSSASSVVYLITMWLLARGLLDLVGSALMRDEIIQDGRMIRAGIDLLLGVVSWVAIVVVPWWELLFGWPESSVGVMRTFAGLSVVAAGGFLITASRAAIRPDSDLKPGERVTASKLPDSSEAPFQKAT
jgi:uncharacterized membrane protein HdeD (DUF308 family)